MTNLVLLQYAMPLVLEKRNRSLKMARKKKQEEKDMQVVDNSAERIKAAREARKKLWEEKQKKEKPQDDRDEFRKFFIRIKGKLGLDESMEKVIWLHFKRAGFDKKEKFEKGIKHFGYEL